MIGVQGDEGFEIDISEGAVADIACDGPLEQVPRTVLNALDQRQLRVVAPVDPADGAPHSATEWLDGCAGLLRVRPESTALLGAAQAAGLPILSVWSVRTTAETADATLAARLEEFILAVAAWRCPRRAYAFYIGRLERDFAQARDALRIAVEAFAGHDLLWIDDGRHTTNVPGIRERTRMLIRHARFVVADLTLGAESPNVENPSRAHEIGMAIAYERPLMLCSQEPRRYPYFSIADMQMSFWVNEQELESLVQRWLRPRRRTLARQVLNHALDGARLAPPVFRYAPELRFVGPSQDASSAT